MIRLHGEERLLNAARLTGGRITVPEETAQAVRTAAEAAGKSEDPPGQLPDEQQKLEEARNKAARELAERGTADTLPEIPVADGDKREPLLSERDELRLRDGAERDSRELDAAVREVATGERGTRQQVREQLQRTEREWVINPPEKVIELEKTLGGD